MNAKCIVDQASSHRGLNPWDERGLARMYPHSEAGYNRDSIPISILLVKYQDIPLDPADAHEVARNPRYGELEASDLSSGVGGDIDYRVEQVQTDEYINIRDTEELTSSTCLD